MLIFFVSPHTPFEILEGKVVHPYATPHIDVLCIFFVWSSFKIYIIDFQTIYVQGTGFLACKNQFRN